MEGKTNQQEPPLHPFPSPLPSFLKPTPFAFAQPLEGDSVTRPTTNAGKDGRKHTWAGRGGLQLAKEFALVSKASYFESTKKAFELLWRKGREFFLFEEINMLQSFSIVDKVF